MADDNEAIDGACPSRRALLAGAGTGAAVAVAVGATGVTGLLAACGADAERPSPAAASTSATTEKASAITATGDIPVGGGKVVDGLLIVQPVAGTFRAYNAACPHKGVLVGTPADGVATCPAHKSTFSIVDGHHLSGPATEGLSPVAITVDGNEVRKG
jgi:nitrite reductase/ring-hydroxylating ferredoxin subunit